MITALFITITILLSLSVVGILTVAYKKLNDILYILWASVLMLLVVLFMIKVIIEINR